MDWIDETDAELSRLRETEARLYWRADTGEPFDAEALRQVADQRRELLTQPQLLTRATSVASECDRTLRRKSELLKHRILLARIEDDPEFVSVRLKIEEATRREHGAEGSPTDSGKRENLFRARIEVGNWLARREGFGNYAEAKLACQELSVPALRRVIASAVEAYLPVCAPVLRECGAESLPPVELGSAVRQRLDADAELMPWDPSHVITETVSCLGLDWERMPITVELCSMPHRGAVHPLKIGRDVRVVIEQAQATGSLRNYALLFHELGHAIYYAFVPDSTLLLDNRIGREGLAEVWAGLIESGEWLRMFSSLKASDVALALSKRRLLHACAVLQLARVAVFELELYGNPGITFREAWDSATRQCLGVEDTTDAYEDWVFLNPLDIKDYALAHLIRKAVVAEIRANCGGDLFCPAAFTFLQRKYYQEANYAPWQERFPELAPIEMS